MPQEKTGRRREVFSEEGLPPLEKRMFSDEERSNLAVA